MFVGEIQAEIRLTSDHHEFRFDASVTGSLPNESVRLAALHALQILDSDFEPEFDGIVKVAAQITKCPIALISLVDADRLWFKASSGLNIRETGKALSMCAAVVESGQPLLVTNALLDPRFKDSPSVTGAPHIRFYLGHPIELMGERLGTLCVIDQTPRALDDEQIASLAALAQTVSALFRSHQRLLVLGARDRLLKKLSQEVPGVIYQFQMNADGTSFFPFASTSMRRIYGFEPHEVRDSAERVFALIHPDDLATVTEKIQHSARTLESWRNEYRVCLPGQSVGWREGQATPELQPDGSVLWHGYISDITERKIAESALYRSQQQAALAISAAGLGIAAWDSATNTISIDELTARHYGLAKSTRSLTVEHWISLIDPADRVAVQRELREAFKCMTAREVRYCMVRSDGQIRYLVCHFRPIRDEFNGVMQMIGATHDVTERHEAERANQAAEAAQQAILAKTAFLGRVSHELRTPLNAILGFAQILAQAPAIRGDASGREHVARITTAGWQLLELINGLLELTEAETARHRMHLEAVKVLEVLERALPLMDVLASKQRVRVNVAAGLEDIWVIADKRRLQQSLINLISNAIKYNHSGGTVTVAACRAAGNVVLRVVDTGCGLSAAQIVELAQPFSRVGAENSLVEGSGLGLAITKSLVERMGGTLDIKSTVGQGSEFSIVLLAAESMPTETVPVPGEEIHLPAFEVPPKPDLGDSADGKVVLYVEDNALNRMVMYGLFEQRPGWRLLLAGDGRECMAILAETRPDLILLDMRLPDCTGLELFAHIGRNPSLASIPVVAISADALPEKITAAKAAGILDYWIKPVDLAKVHQFLTRLSETKSRQDVYPDGVL